MQCMVVMVADGATMKLVCEALMSWPVALSYPGMILIRPLMESLQRLKKSIPSSANKECEMIRHAFFK